MHRVLAIGLAVGALAAALPAFAEPADDGAATPQFKEGDIITMDSVEKLKPFLPEQFWDNRDFFFYEGMQLEIGPTQYDYSPPKEWNDMTVKYHSQAKIGPDDSLAGWVTGYPFPQEQIDCKNDPTAGAKIMWDFQAPGGDGHAHFFYSYWDRGEQLPLYYEGTGQTVRLSHRFEKSYEDQGFDTFRGEKR